mmetsp:Transcript_10143/g.19865  ORF Transcript_10143/g.19865 Transcript_10143/m.19865 type:complete len:268 (+) Transcript_10143:144-947(+)
MIRLACCCSHTGYPARASLKKDLRKGSHMHATICLRCLSMQMCTSTARFPCILPSCCRTTYRIHLHPPLYTIAQCLKMHCHSRIGEAGSNPRSLAFEYLSMNLINLSQSSGLFMMYLASMYTGLPPRNLAFRTDSIKLTSLLLLLSCKIFEGKTTPDSQNFTKVMMNINGNNQFVLICLRTSMSIVLRTPSSSTIFIPDISPGLLTSTFGLSNLKDATPDSPSRDRVSRISGMACSATPSTNSIRARLTPSDWEASACAGTSLLLWM